MPKLFNRRKLSTADGFQHVLCCALPGFLHRGFAAGQTQIIHMDINSWGISLVQVKRVILRLQNDNVAAFGDSLLLDQYLELKVFEMASLTCSQHLSWKQCSGHS